MSDNTLKPRTLDKDAVIGGKLVTAGTEVQITGTALEQAYKDAAKLTTRAAIAAGVGDTDSVLGTASDTAQFLLVEFASLVTKIAGAKDLNAVKEAAKASADKLSKLNTAVQRGEVVFPFQTKDGGEAAILQEIADKASLTSSALKGEEVSKPLLAVSPSEDISNETPPPAYTPVS